MCQVSLGRSELHFTKEHGTWFNDLSLIHSLYASRSYSTPSSSCYFRVIEKGTIFMNYCGFNRDIIVDHTGKKKIQCYKNRPVIGSENLLEHDRAGQPLFTGSYIWTCNISILILFSMFFTEKHISIRI